MDELKLKIALANTETLRMQEHKKSVNDAFLFSERDHYFRDRTKMVSANRRSSVKKSRKAKKLSKRKNRG